MADTGIFATTLEVQEKAGANASEVSNTEAYINSYVSQAESLINIMTRFNWSDKYSTLSQDIKKILTETASNFAAIYVIQYDMSNYNSNIEAEDMVTILRDAALRGISLLRDIKVQTFMLGETA